VFWSPVDIWCGTGVVSQCREVGGRTRVPRSVSNLEAGLNSNVSLVIYLRARYFKESGTYVSALLLGILDFEWVHSLRTLARFFRSLSNFLKDLLLQIEQVVDAFFDLSSGANNGHLVGLCLRSTKLNYFVNQDTQQDFYLDFDIKVAHNSSNSRASSTDDSLEIIYTY
jgi:hypothetical protein